MKKLRAEILVIALLAAFSAVDIMDNLMMGGAGARIVAMPAPALPEAGLAGPPVPGIIMPGARGCLMFFVPSPRCVNSLQERH